VTLYLTEEQVGELLTPADAVDAIEACFQRLARGAVENRPRYRLRLEHGALAVMAAADLELGYAGAKVYAGFDEGAGEDGTSADAGAMAGAASLVLCLPCAAFLAELDTQPALMRRLLDAFAQRSLLPDAAFESAYRLERSYPAPIWQSEELLLFRRNDTVGP